MSTETPRTDSADLIVPSDITPDDQWCRNGQYVSADFARTLERELTAAQQENERLREALRNCDAARTFLAARRALGEEG